MILLRCPKFRNDIGPRCAIRPVGTFVPAERGTALKTACYICHWQRCAVFPAVSAAGSARIAPHIAPPYSDLSSTVVVYERQRRRKEVNASYVAIITVFREREVKGINYEKEIACADS